MKYRHYKGGIYELVCEATQESDLTPVIVYRASDGSVWTRPKAVFFELLDIDGKQVQRFTPIEDEPSSQGRIGPRVPTELDKSIAADLEQALRNL